MSAYLVDTDWIIQALRGDGIATQILINLAPTGLAISLITYGELYQGAYYAHDPQRMLVALDAILENKEIVPLSLAIMRRFAILRGRLTRNQRQQIGDMDLLIAATAIQHDLTLITFNERDYRLVAGIKLYER
jgi:predicted nucleic acid-binding protein